MEPSFHILLLKYKCLSWRFLVDACLNCKCNYCPANLSHYFFTQNSQPACVNGPLGNPSNLNDSVIHGQVSSIINFLHSFDLRLMGFLLDMFIHDQFFFFFAMQTVFDLCLQLTKLLFLWRRKNIFDNSFLLLSNISRCLRLYCNQSHQPFC